MKEGYQITRVRALELYNKIQTVRCPALNHQIVHFSSEGFNHLIYKRKRKERTRKVQAIKLRLLPKAHKLIEISTTYQEYDERITDTASRKGKTILVKYWGLVAIMNGYRIKAIIRQLGNGQKHFWSVIPAWNISYYRDIKLRSLSKGDLEED